MNRNQIVAGSVLVIILLGVGGSIYLILFQPNFSWAIDIGDEFIYEIGLHYENGRSGGSWYGGNLEDQGIMDGSQVVATITTLPSVDGLFNSSAFLERVIRFKKVECRYVNGTIHPGGVYLLNSLISTFILPVGGWTTLEFFFPISSGSWPFRVEANIEGNHLFISIMQWGYDDLTSMQGNVTLSNGIPTSMIWEYSHSSDEIWLELTLL